MRKKQSLTRYLYEEFRSRNTNGRLRVESGGGLGDFYVQVEEARFSVVRFQIVGQVPSIFAL